MGKAFYFSLAVAAVGVAAYFVTRPKLLAGGAFAPSILTIKAFTSDVSDYDKTVYPTPYTGALKVLVVCTEEHDLEMANGNLFSTGNHPVETLLPMLHMKAAGFDFELATPTGKPVAFEMWAMPTRDEAVQQLFRELAPQLANPTPLEAVAPSLEGYAAIFVPGGHGALIDLPQNANLGALLRAAHAKALPTFSLCHGPGALLSAAVGSKEPFIYAGYEIVVFPDSIDKFTPYLGYLPGPMPVWIGELLTAKGLVVTNDNMDGSTHAFKELITGDSPLASNNLGKAAAAVLLKTYAA
jgi:molecular chaperone Hsp31 and glyoxalase 3